MVRFNDHGLESDDKAQRKLDPALEGNGANVGAVVHYRPGLALGFGLDFPLTNQTHLP